MLIQVAIVTGGNTGIGYLTVRWLLKKNAKVYLAARSEGRAREAIQKGVELALISSSGKGQSAAFSV